MNAPSVKFGIVSASAVNPAPANPKTSGDTSAAFALELNALWVGSPDLQADTEAGTSLNTENAQGRTGEEKSPAGGRGFPSAVVTHGSEVQAAHASNAPSDGPSKSAAGNKSIEGTPNTPPIAFVSRGATSAGSFISGQNPGHSDSLSLLPAIYRSPSLAQSPAVFTWPTVQERTVARASKDEQVQSPPGRNSCATKYEIESPSRDAGQNVSLTGKTQWPVAYRQFAEASLETDQNAKALVVPFAGKAGSAEPTAQPNLQSTSSLVTSPLSNLPAQLNLEGSDQPERAYGEFSDVSPLTPGEPKNGEQGPVKTPISSSSAAEVTQDAQSQATADWTGHYFVQLDAEITIAPTMLQPPTAQPQVLVNGNADSTSGRPGSPNPPSAGMSPYSQAAGAPGAYGTVVVQSGNLLGQTQPTDSAGPQRNEAQNQDDGGNVTFNPLAFSAELTSRDADLSREIAIPHANLSSITPFRSPASDKSADSDRVGTSRDNNEAPSGYSNVAPATSVWTQAVSDPNSASDPSQQGSQQGYLADRTPTPTPSKSLPFASAAQKASAAGSDTSSEMAVDPRQGVRWDSDAQNGSAPSSADSLTSHAPTFSNGDSAMVHSVQNVNSARLAETTGQSEIQVNLKSDSLGPVSVHATLSNGQVGAEIQVSDRDAHAALTEALHTLEKNLGENGIQVSNLNVSHGLGYNHAQSQNQQEKQAGQSTYAARSYTHRSAVSDDIPVASKGVNTIDDFVLGRVSVRA